MATAYPTVAEVKTYLSASAATDDAVITQIVNGVVDFVERYCGHKFIEAAAQTIYVSPEYPNVLGRHRRVLLVRDYDLVSVTTLTNGDAVVVASTDYRLLPLDGPPYFMIELDADSGLYWWRGSDGAGVVTIVGTTGWKTDAVPDAIFLGILEFCKHVYKTRSSGGEGPVTLTARGGVIIPPGSVPQGVLDKLDLYARRRA